MSLNDTLDRVKVLADQRMDDLHKKENEIARLLTALTRIHGVLRLADTADNVETVGRAREIASAALTGTL